MLSISSGHGSNLQRENIFGSDYELGVALCPNQSAESLGRCEEGSLVLQENLKMDNAEPGLSDALSLHKLADNTPSRTRHKACHCLKPKDIAISQDDHFPMYGINRRIEGILNRKKGTECCQIAGRPPRLQMQHAETAPISHVIEFASEERHQLETQRSTGKDPNTEYSKSVRTSPTCKDDLTGSTSQRADGSFNCLRPNFVFSNFSELRRKGSWSTDHRCSKHSINEFKKERCNLSGSSRLLLSEMKDNDEMISSCVKSSSPGKNFKSMGLLRNLWSTDLHFSCQVNKTSGSRRQSNCGDFVHFQRSNDLGLRRPKLDKMASSSIHDAETLKLHTTSNSMDNINGGSQNISSSFRYWLIAKNMGTELSHGEQLNVNPTKSAKGKTAALYEMVTTPAILKQQEDSQNLVSSSRSGPSGHGDDGSWSDAHIMVTDNALAIKAATIPVDVCQKEVSLECVVVSAKPQKEPECPRLLKFQSVSPSLVQKTEYSDAKAEILDDHVHCPIAENTGNIKHRESSVSGTESMNVDLTISHVERSHEPNPGSTIEKLQVEPCSRWLKRLRHSSSDIQSNSSKRSKIENGPTIGETCSLSSSVINYKDSNSGQQVYDMRNSSPNNSKYLHGPSTEELKCWIQRWCHKDTQMPQSRARTTASVSYEQENTKLVPESSEGKQFPSIAAMALMGKVMKRLRTCEFQKRGFSVIWNAEGL